MASGFIAVAVAHDYTCPKGEEWIFKGLPKEGDANKTEPCAKNGEEKVGFLEVFLWVLGVLIIGGFAAISLWLIIGF
jgi:hypothetical protein